MFYRGGKAIVLAGYKELYLFPDREDLTKYEQLNAPCEYYLGKIFSPESDDSLLVTYNKNIVYISNDLGQNWRVLAECDGIVKDMALSKTEAERLYVTTERGVIMINMESGYTTLLNDGIVEGTASVSAIQISDNGEMAITQSRGAIYTAHENDWETAISPIVKKSAKSELALYQKNEKLFLNIKNAGMISITSTELNGRNVELVKGKYFSAGTHAISIDILGEVSKGVHFLTVKKEGNRKTVKVMIR